MSVPKTPEDVNFTRYTCEEYASHLAAREPIPGGGGAAAYTGALGIALAAMAGAFALGKPRYAAYEKDLTSHIARAERLRKELLELVNEDSRQFLLVSDAFAIPKDNPSRSTCIEEALIAAAKPPLRVMEVICETIALTWVAVRRFPAVPLRRPLIPSLLIHVQCKIAYMPHLLTSGQKRLWMSGFRERKLFLAT